MTRIFSILLLFCFLLPVYRVNAQDYGSSETITKEIRYSINSVNNDIKPNTPPAFGGIDAGLIAQNQYKGSYQIYDAKFGPVTINLHPPVPKGELSVEDLQKLSMIITGEQVACMFFAPPFVIPLRLGQVAVEFQITRKKTAIFKEENAQLCLMLSDGRLIPSDYVDASGKAGGYTLSDLCMPERSKYLWIKIFFKSLISLSMPPTWRGTILTLQGLRFSNSVREIKWEKRRSSSRQLGSKSTIYYDPHLGWMEISNLFSSRIPNVSIPKVYPGANKISAVKANIPVVPIRVAAQAVPEPVQKELQALAAQNVKGVRMVQQGSNGVVVYTDQPSSSSSYSSSSSDSHSLDIPKSVTITGLGSFSFSH